MEKRFFQYILRIFSAIYNPKVFIFFIFFYYVITIVEAVTFWRSISSQKLCDMISDDDPELILTFKLFKYCRYKREKLYQNMVLIAV